MSVRGADRFEGPAAAPLRPKRPASAKPAGRRCGPPPLEASCGPRRPRWWHLQRPSGHCLEAPGVGGGSSAAHTGPHSGWPTPASHWPTPGRTAPHRRRTGPHRLSTGPHRLPSGESRTRSLPCRPGADCAVDSAPRAPSALRPAALVHPAPERRERLAHAPRRCATGPLRRPGTLQSPQRGSESLKRALKRALKRGPRGGPRRPYVTRPARRTVLGCRSRAPRRPRQ